MARWGQNLRLRIYDTEEAEHRVRTQILTERYTVSSVDCDQLTATQYGKFGYQRGGLFESISERVSLKYANLNDFKVYNEYVLSVDRKPLCI